MVIVPFLFQIPLVGFGVTENVNMYLKYRVKRKVFQLKFRMIIEIGWIVKIIKSSPLMVLQTVII